MRGSGGCRGCVCGADGADTFIDVKTIEYTNWACIKLGMESVSNLIPWVRRLASYISFSYYRIFQHLHKPMYSVILFPVRTLLH